jgi:hypothetical protein
MDPQRREPYFVQPKVEKLVRRGPREYVMVGTKPDGEPIEVRLAPASFRSMGPNGR